MNNEATGAPAVPVSKPMDVIAITSGKGGVGKTNIAVNLAVSKAKLGRKVVVFDGDLGLANVDVALGLKPRYDISHVVSGDCSIEDVLLDGPHGIRIVPASSGLSSMTVLTARERANIIQAFSSMSGTVDTLIVDTGAGIDNSVQAFCSACQSVIVVICDEPSSIADAYALIKVLNRDSGVRKFQLLANMVDTEASGRGLFEKLCRVTDRFLDVSLDYIGAVPRDRYLKKSVQQQGAVVDLYPRSDSAQALIRIAKSIDVRSSPYQGVGRLGFFVERLVLEESQRVGAW